MDEYSTTCYPTLEEKERCQSKLKPAKYFITKYPPKTKPRPSTPISGLYTGVSASGISFDLFADVYESAIVKDLTQPPNYYKPPIKTEDQKNIELYESFTPKTFEEELNEWEVKLEAQMAKGYQSTWFDRFLVWIGIRTI